MIARITTQALRALADRADGGELAAAIGKATDTIVALRELTERLQSAAGRLADERDDAIAARDAAVEKLAHPTAQPPVGRTVTGHEIARLSYGTVLLRTDEHYVTRHVAVRTYGGWWSAVDEHRGPIDPTLTYLVLHDPGDAWHPLRADEVPVPSGPPTHLLDSEDDLWAALPDGRYEQTSIIGDEYLLTRAEIAAWYGPTLRDVWVVPAAAVPELDEPDAATTGAMP